jgi:hypothetical protein
VPFLILLASLLLAVADPLRKWLTKRSNAGAGMSAEQMATWAVVPVGLAAVYGGYFGAGLSVIVLAVLGLMLNDNLTRLNALKQAVSFSVNIAYSLSFRAMIWPAAAVMAVRLAGGTVGAAGGRSSRVLRRVVVD